MIAQPQSRFRKLHLAWALLFALALPVGASVPAGTRWLEWTPYGAAAPASLTLQPKSERLIYEIGWSGIPAARAEWRLEPQRMDGQTYLSVRAEAKTYSYVSLFWKMRDQAEAIMTADPVRPLAFELTQRENSLRRQTRFDFDHDLGALEIVRNEKKGDKQGRKRSQLALADQYDPISAALALRGLPLDIGDGAHVRVHTGKSLYRVSFTVLGRETVEVPAGTFKAIILQPEAYNLDKDRPNDKLKSAKIWVSDDERRVVLKVESEVFIGSVYAELTELD